MTTKWIETYLIAGEMTPTDAMAAATLKARGTSDATVTIIETEPLRLEHWRVTVERNLDPLADFGAFEAPPIVNLHS